MIELVKNFFIENEGILNKMIMPFLLLSIPIIIFSWRSIVKFKSHGFFRFFSWECILWLFINNVCFWFRNSFSLPQIFSWILLLVSSYMLISGVMLMIKKGKPDKERNEKSLYAFEKTTKLLKTGVFKHIRHPLYASLIYLTWGIYLKNHTFSLLIIAILSSIFIYLTAKIEERENIDFFGEEYKNYMKESKMFVPFLF